MFFFISVLTLFFKQWHGVVPLLILLRKIKSTKFLKIIKTCNPGPFSNRLSNFFWLYTFCLYQYSSTNDLLLKNNDFYATERLKHCNFFSLSSFLVIDPGDDIARKKEENRQILVFKDK